MTHQTTTSHIASTRTVSHKLLRKIAARTAAPVRGESIEDAFPGALTRSDEVGGLLELPQAAAAASAPATGKPQRPPRSLHRWPRWCLST